jgi:hypothetical protein
MRRRLDPVERRSLLVGGLSPFQSDAERRQAWRVHRDELEDAHPEA